MKKTLLKINHIAKYYPGVKALDDINFEVYEGETHAICGENGAGKSTFIKIITGAITPSKGTIEFNGNVYDHLMPPEAMDLGIAVIYQEFSLIPYLSVAENIFYGREIRKGCLLDRAKMNDMARILCKEMDVNLDIEARVCDLGVAYQQIVEIMKAVSRKAKLLIMDEPTAPLTLNETQIFFSIVRKLQKDGVTIIFISHRLEEIFELCHRVTVFCDGKYVATKTIAEIDKKQLISFMVGRELADDYPNPHNKKGEVVLKVEHVTNRSIRDVSFALYRGEILGCGGLVGAGRTELVRAIFGADPLESGTMFLKGRQYRPRLPGDALQAGIGLIPEDRKNQGVILGLSIKENMVYSVLDRCCTKLFSYILTDKETAYVNKYIKELNIKTPDASQLVRNLSGGNQQKVVLGKMLATECDILIFDEPTRGIDVGAKYEIYQLMCNIAKQGKSIIMISSEMPELIGMSDRIIVMSGGSIAGELMKKEFSQERILELASTH
ncbi:putative ribose/galactose/methyl galactoside import ATP-binding protein [Propionispora sp. 2/2-37]|uniref:sugar ABC transporter ATP-binding protein n=1 Tax=Propionispora sp. 2/2-37 TaxID=1677858 RepID=UPI0006BB7492|nr:sugar ABC transporter ATP-binding protein [Propionispora sp. 2/2-37]CUH96651.1 putative ribose/galactose/methyl galactoside import ATP-binding protein [Propionispora sp. 2/2-37]